MKFSIRSVRKLLDLELFHYLEGDVEENVRVLHFS